METKFNFKSQICTSREQSERLLALGLKKETADMYYRWSLDRLREMLNKSGVTISFVERDTSIIVERYGVFQNVFEIWDNVYDNICNAVEWLIKEGYFPKEYLV